MITKEDIRKALNVIDDINVEYGKKDAEGIKEIDDALDLIQLAAQKYMNIGADNYKARAAAENKAEFAKVVKNFENKLAEGVLHQATDAPITDNDEITIKPLNGPAKTYEAEGPRGFWEPMENDGKPLIMPMRVCSECQKTNFYPGRFCTYCKSDNGQDDGKSQDYNKEALFVLKRLFYDCDNMTPKEYDILYKAIMKGGAK